MTTAESLNLNCSEDRRNREGRVISRSLKKLLVPGPDFHLASNSDEQRDKIESFIAARFHKCHDARISTFLPMLLAMQCYGKYTAALGINPARLEPLFLEQYLDQTAEQTVASVVKAPVSRASIVEIGNLVSNLNGATALLYLILLATLHRAGFRWVMFTATPEVQRSIGKSNFKIAPICVADPSRIAHPEQWGSYYDVQPQVMLGYIEDSYESCLRNPLLESTLELTTGTVSGLAARVAAH